MLNTCPHTGERFYPKRRNQVFATSKNRRDYHNEIARQLRHIKSPVDRQLEKNFKILSELLVKGETKVFKKEDLLMKGFNTAYFTNFDTNNGKPVMCVYNFLLPQSEIPNQITVIFPNND
jgi:hypothetical protein